MCNNDSVLACDGRHNDPLTQKSGILPHLMPRFSLLRSKEFKSAP